MITNQDFEIPEGDTRAIAIALKNADGTPYTVPGGAAVYWWASRSMHDGAGALVKGSTADFVVLTAAGGGTTMTIYLQPTHTNGRAWQNLYHEGYVIQADGVRVRLFSGTMKVTKSLIP